MDPDRIRRERAEWEAAGLQHVIAVPLAQQPRRATSGRWSCWRTWCLGRQVEGLTEGVDVRGRRREGVDDGGENMDRRSLLQGGIAGAGAMTFAPQRGTRAVAAAPPPTAGPGPYGPLRRRTPTACGCPPASPGASWPRGLQPVDGTGAYPPYEWHVFPDGGATFPTPTAAGSTSPTARRSAAAAAACPRCASPPTAPSRRVPHPVGHQHQLRGRAHAVGHVAVVRGATRGPRVGVRPVQAGTGHRPARPRDLPATRPSAVDPVHRQLYLTEDAARRALLPVHAERTGPTSPPACSRRPSVGPRPQRLVRVGGRRPTRAAELEHPSAGHHAFDGGEGCWFARTASCTSPPRATTGCTCSTPST